MMQTRVHSALRQFHGLLATQQLGSLSDAQLLERFVRTRDEAAFALLVQRHGRLVWSACRQSLRQEQDVEDAYQASFLVLVRHAASIRSGQTVACWLYRVASRIARKLAMERSKRPARQRRTTDNSEGPVIQELAWRELQAMLQEELARLPEKYQAPFVLCCLEGQSKAEAARQLGWKEGTVSSRLAHARKQLQQRLSRRGVAFAAVLGAAELFLHHSRATAGLAQATVRAAICFAAGTPVSGVLSARAIALMEGVTSAMFLSKVKCAVMIVLAVCLIGGGAGALAWQGQGDNAFPQQARQSFAEWAQGTREQPAARAAKQASARWIGIASRETNSGPSLRVVFEDGTRQTSRATADTVLLSYLSNTPLGSHEVLSVDLNDTNRILLQFDLPKEGRVRKAEVLLSRSQSAHPLPSQPVNVVVHEVKESWDEARTCWDRQPAFVRRPALTAEIDPADKEYRLDVTALVRRAVEEHAPYHGWLVRIATPLAAEEARSRRGPPAGWSCHGDDYAFQVDEAVRHGGSYSCRIESRSPRPSSFAMMSQTIRADDYRGERVRLTGYIKTEQLEGMATLWTRIDGVDGLLGIDKTVEEAVRGTSDWRQPHIVIDVPESSKTIRFAVLVEGAGKAWIDDLKLEIVERSVPVTNPSTDPRSKIERKPELPRRPVNLDFEAPETPGTAGSK
ncbi:MAG TPA: sigma-70 family RNA polymerase sigma factor [Gemmataceae bacterium]|nr:sigma-70 family RNA polymerase sigma factor [Gemmataceae bacterium]